jgi:hypothetical protein
MIVLENLSSALVTTNSVSYCVFDVQTKRWARKQTLQPQKQEIWNHCLIQNCWNMQSHNPICAKLCVPIKHKLLFSCHTSYAYAWSSFHYLMDSISRMTAAVARTYEVKLPVNSSVWIVMTAGIIHELHNLVISFCSNFSCTNLMQIKYNIKV